MHTANDLEDAPVMRGLRTTLFDVSVESKKVVAHLFLVKNSRAPLRSRLTQNGSLLDPLAKWFLYLGWASLTVTCLRCPVWLVSRRLWFVPACAFLAVARASFFLFSGSPLAVSASCLLGCGWLCAFLIVAITARPYRQPK